MFGIFLLSTLPLSEGSYTMSIAAFDEISLRSSDSLHLRAVILKDGQPIVPSEDVVDATWEWVSDPIGYGTGSGDGSGWGSGLGGDECDLRHPGVSSNTGTLLIAPNVFIPGCQYDVTARSEFTSEGMSYSLSDMVSVTSTRTSLYAHVYGGTFRTEMWDPEGTLTLDASQSFDPDYPDAALSFTWQLNGTTLAASSPDPVLSLDASALSQGLHEISVVVSSDAAIEVSTATAFTSVLLQAGTPSVYVDAQVPYMSKNTVYRFNPSDRIALLGAGSFPHDVDLLWSVSFENGTVPPFDLAEAAETSLSRPDLMLSADTLAPGENYRFRLSATPSPSNGQGGYADIVLSVNSLPTGGACTIDPPDAEGVGMITLFTLECTGWHDVDSVETLLFQVQLVDSRGWLVPMTGRLPTSSHSVVLPVPSEAVGIKSISAFVYDADGGFTTRTFEVAVSQPPLDDACDLLVRAVDIVLPAMQRAGDPDGILRESIALTPLLSLEACGSASEVAPVVADLLDIVWDAYSATDCEKSRSESTASICGDMTLFTSSLSDEIDSQLGSFLCSLSECLGENSLLNNATAGMLVDSLAFYAGATRTSADTMGAMECLDAVMNALLVDDVAGGQPRVVSAPAMRVCAFREEQFAMSGTTFAMSELCEDDELPNFRFSSQGNTDQTLVNVDAGMWAPGVHPSANTTPEKDVVSTISSVVLTIPGAASSSDTLSRVSSSSSTTGHAWSGSGELSGSGGEERGNGWVRARRTPRYRFGSSSEWKPVQQSRIGGLAPMVDEGTPAPQESNPDPSSPPASDDPTLIINTLSMLGLDPIDIFVKTDVSAREECAEEEVTCEFYDAEHKVWETEGCETLIDDDGQPYCSCSHLTDFALLRYDRDKYNGGYCVFSEYHDLFLSLSVVYAVASVAAGVQCVSLVRSKAKGLDRHRQINLLVAVVTSLRCFLYIFGAAGLLDDVPYVIGTLMQALIYFAMFVAFALVVLSLAMATGRRTTTSLRDDPLGRFMLGSTALFFVTIVTMFVCYTTVDSGNYVVAVVGQSLLASISLVSAVLFYVHGTKVMRSLLAGARLRGKSDTGDGAFKKVYAMTTVYTTMFCVQAILHLLSVGLYEVFYENLVIFQILMSVAELGSLLTLLWFYRNQNALKVFQEHLIQAKDKLSQSMQL